MTLQPQPRHPRSVRYVRLLAGLVLALPLAVLTGAQALSNVATRDNPALALEVFPANGEAKARLAFADYASFIDDPAAPPPPREEAVALAREAMLVEPLSQRAYVVLAQAEPDPARRRAILEGAAQLNRRDLALQSLILQERFAQDDHSGAIETLDQILRVHPQRSEEFFPALASALLQKETVPAFAQILDGKAPWHRRFLNYAVQLPAAGESLARLRAQLAVEDAPFDRKLIAALVAQDKVSLAEDIYADVSARRGSPRIEEAIDWQVDYPPFDWELADRSVFRAQVSRDGSELEIYVKPGQGGVIASRLMPAPKTGFTIELRHTLEPSSQVDDVEVQVSCAETRQTLIDERLKPGVNRFSSRSVPGKCHYILLAIAARAWSGEAPLGGTITAIAVSPAEI